MPGEPTVWVLGDCILDRSRFVTYARQSPEDPTCPVGVNERAEWVLGGAANVAHWLAGLGGIARVSLIAHFARLDPHAGVLTECLQAAGVTQCCHLQRRDGRGTVKERLYLSDETGSRQVLRVDQDTDMELTAEETALLMEGLALSLALARPAALVVADYGKGIFAGSHWPLLLKELERFVSHHRIPVIVNSKHPFRWSRFATDVLVANEAEMRTLEGRPTDARHVITTHAERGVTAHINSDPWTGVQVHAPTRARQVQDVTGAGDAFLAGLARHLVAVQFGRGHVLSAERLRDAINAGQAAAATCVSQMGCGTPTKGEVTP